MNKNLIIVLILFFLSSSNASASFVERAKKKLGGVQQIFKRQPDIKVPGEKDFAELNMDKGTAEDYRTRLILLKNGLLAAINQLVDENYKKKYTAALNKLANQGLILVRDLKEIENNTVPQKMNYQLFALDLQNVAIEKPKNAVQKKIYDALVAFKARLLANFYELAEIVRVKGLK